MGSTSIHNAGTVANNYVAYIANGDGSEGDVRVREGSTWTNASHLTIGWYGGTAGLSISSGGKVTNNFGYLAYGDNARGDVTVTGPGSSWTTNGDLEIASGGTSRGTLTIDGGGAASNTNAIIGHGGSGQVTVRGVNSSWTSTGDLTVGHFTGTGTVSILDGATVTNTNAKIGSAMPYVAYPLTTGSVLVSDPGSTWTSTGDVTIGGTGVGSVTLQNGGKMSVTGAVNLVQEWLSPTTSTLIIGAASGSTPVAPGFIGIQNNLIDGGSGYGGTVVFNHTGGEGSLPEYLFTSDGTYTNGSNVVSIVGNASVLHEHGTTVFATGMNYNGPTNVTGGELYAEGLFGSSAVTVSSGATFGAGGPIAGSVSIAEGATFIPGRNAPITLSVGSLALGDTSLLKVDLDNPGVVGNNVNDLITVQGDLTLDGLLSIEKRANFGVGTYRLMDYGGTLTDNGLRTGDGGLNYDFRINTLTAGQVNFIVTDALNYWDGSQLAANNAVDGGTGTWTNATTNWTNPSGSENGPWSTKLAVFSGAAGVVTLGDDVTYRGMHFTTDGYTINPDAGGAYSLVPNSAFDPNGGGVPIEVDNGVTATINAPITGNTYASSLVKTGAGNLILGGADSYKGGTTVYAGTLTVAPGGAINDPSGQLTVGVGPGDNAALVVSGGSISTGLGVVGFSGGAIGTATVTSGNWSNGYLHVGYQGTGTLNVSGGSVTTALTAYPGGPVLDATFSVGESGTGLLNLSGGAVTTNGTAYLGRNAGASGTATVTGGQWDVTSSLRVGDKGTGALNISGGRVSAQEYVYTGYGPTGDGTINLSGNAGTRGVLEATGLVKGAGGGNLVLDGGILRALADNPDFLAGYDPTTITIKGGGAFIDSNGFSIGTDAQLFGVGPLIKEGAGVFTLRGANDYHGGTQINAGTLAVSGGDALPNGESVTLANAAGAALELLNNETIGSLAGGGAAGGNVVLHANKLTTGGGGDTTYAGVISGSGSLEKIGGGTQTLTGANTYAGSTVVRQGTLEVATGGSITHALADTIVGNTNAAMPHC